MQKLRSDPKSRLIQFELLPCIAPQKRASQDSESLHILINHFHAALRTHIRIYLYYQVDVPEDDAPENSAAVFVQSLINGTDYNHTHRLQSRQSQYYIDLLPTNFSSLWAPTVPRLPLFRCSLRSFALRLALRV